MLCWHIFRCDSHAYPELAVSIWRVGADLLGVYVELKFTEPDSGRRKRCQNSWPNSSGDVQPNRLVRQQGRPPETQCTAHSSA